MGRGGDDKNGPKPKSEAQQYERVACEASPVFSDGGSGDIYTAEPFDHRPAVPHGGWWCLCVAVAVVGVYVGSLVSLAGVEYYRQPLYDKLFVAEDEWENPRYSRAMGFWYVWDHTARVFLPWILQHDHEDPEESRYRKDLRFTIPGSILVAASFALLLTAASKLAPLRDAWVGRRLQRFPRCCRCPARLSFLRLTWSEGLVDAFMIGICVYWYFSPWIGEEDWGRWPWPFGEGRVRYHLGSMSGWAMTLALVPIPKHSPLMHLIGMSFEKGIRVHRWMGRISVLCAVLHTVLIIIAWEERTSAIAMWAEVGPLAYTIEEITPWCTREPSPPWPWNETGNWLADATPGNGSFVGWGVPAEFRQYEGEIAEQCPWLYDTTHTDYEYECNDGTLCRGSRCCYDHGQRAKCPPHRPNMCAGIPGVEDTFCVNLGKTLVPTDHCCEAWDCTGEGSIGTGPANKGGLRPCHLNITDATGEFRNVTLDGVFREPRRKTNGCLTEDQNRHNYLLYHLGWTGTRHGIYNFFGCVATLMFVLLALGGLETVRRNFFEVFYKSHIVCSLLAFLGLAFHWDYGGLDDAGLIIIIMLVDYLWRYWLIRSGDAAVTAVEVIRMNAAAGGGGDVIKLTLSHPKIRVTEPGQYCFIRIGQLGQWQWHPFSVASTPGFSDETDGSFVIYVRDFGSWTRELVESGPALLSPGGAGPAARVSLDGMFGRISVPFETYSSLIITAGGIGCTPMFSVLQHLAEQPPGRRPDHVCVVWSVRELELVRCFEPELACAAALGWDVRVHLTAKKRAAERCPQTGAEAGQTGAQCPFGAEATAPETSETSSLIAEETSASLSESGDGLQGHVHAGRPDMPAIFAEVARHLQKRQRKPSACAVLTCGPAALVDSTKEACVTAGGEIRFELHSETFDF